LYLGIIIIIIIIIAISELLTALSVWRAAPAFYNEFCTFIFTVKQWNVPTVWSHWPI
jgi:hypothetical protein